MEPLTPEELRVVACLVEKQLTTPDSYPLTENAVTAACNQLSNRNPVVAYDNNTVRVTLTALRQRGLARVIHTPGARVPKHRHILDEALGPDAGRGVPAGGAGPAGPADRRRAPHPHRADARLRRLSEVEETLEGLAARDEPLVARLERQPGQKEARYAQLLGRPARRLPRSLGRRRHPGHHRRGECGQPARRRTGHVGRHRHRLGRAGPPEVAPAPAGPTAASSAADAERLAALEKRLAAVEAELAILQAEHSELREDLGLAADRRPPVSDGTPAIEPD